MLAQYQWWSAAILSRILSVMPKVPLQKRPNDLFVSYGHPDKSVVERIVGWLHRSAGLNVWCDVTSGNASKRTTELLADAIGLSRGSLFVLSSNWRSSSWCRDEHEYSLTQKRENDAFLVVAIRIDDAEIPDWFKISNVVDFRTFGARSAGDLLRSMVADAPGRYDNEQDVYFAGPWSRPIEALTPALNSLHEMGWRLVGDSPDRPNFVDAATRIRSIVNTTRGLVALLAYDPSKPNQTSPWILDEVRIAKHLEKPFLLIAEEGVEVPAELATAAFGGRVVSVAKGEAIGSLRKILSDFDDELLRRPHTDAGSYSFLATSLHEADADVEEIVGVLQRATNMSCVRGFGLVEQHAQTAIIERIRNAAFVMADVSESHRNTLIEAGIALGAGTPLHLLSRPPDDGSFKTRFMFQDKEINWYQDGVDRLGSVYRIGRLYRRRVYGNPRS
jgi:hypothetical protein